jgi:hypothetical protein
MSLQDSGAKFKWPVAVQRQIEAPAARVWQVISSPGNLESCHPFCAKNPVHAWPGANSRDEVHYLSGWAYERHFYEWHEGVGYDLDIGRCGGNKSRVCWRIVPIGEDCCVLRITVYPHILQSLPTLVRWVPHLLWLRPLLRKYLDSVVRGFEWNVINGQAVAPNQFGKHPWFSTASSRSG